MFMISNYARKEGVSEKKFYNTEWIKHVDSKYRTKIQANILNGLNDASNNDNSIN